MAPLKLERVYFAFRVPLSDCEPHWELWIESQLDMSQLTPKIPFMASLWSRSGCDMKVELSAETCQVGAYFRALIKAILLAPSRILENFFPFHISLPRCGYLMEIRFGLVNIVIRALVTVSEIFYISNHWNCNSNHWTWLYPPKNRGSAGKKSCKYSQQNTRKSSISNIQQAFFGLTTTFVITFINIWCGNPIHYRTDN